MVFMAEKGIFEFLESIKNKGETLSVSPFPKNDIMEARGSVIS